MDKFVFNEVDVDPARVMPIGAGGVGAMLGLRDRGVALLLSQSEFFGVPPRPAHPEYPRHQLSPGEITLFPHLSSAEITRFHQELAPERGSCRLDFTADGNAFTVTVQSDLANRLLIVEVAAPGAFPLYFSALRPGTAGRIEAERVLFYESGDEGKTLHTEIAFDTTISSRKISPARWEILPADAAFKFTIRCESTGGKAADFPATHPFDALLWQDFFSESQLELSGGELPETFAYLWKLNFYSVKAFDDRFYPTRFSGGVGTVRGDDRYWGSFYWFQNQRELLWPLGAANHLSLLRRQLDYFAHLYNYCRTLTRQNGYDGLHLPELLPYIPEKEFTYHFETTPFTPQLLTRERPHRLDDQPSGWVTHILSNGGELLQLMLDYLQYSGDRGYFTEVFAPHLHEIALFYLEYLKLGEDDLYHLTPAHANEMFRMTTDPAGGLCAVRLALLAAQKYGRQLHFEAEFLAAVEERLARLAPLPQGREVQLTAWQQPASWVAADVYSPMRDFTDDPRQWNVEHPELYVVFPFAAVDAQSPEAEYQRAVRTFRHRKFPCGSGWSQCPVQAARLALPDTAEIVAEHWQKHQHFPYGGWDSPGGKLAGSRFDVSIHPYLDSAGVNACAVNEMLLQSHHLLDELPDDPCVGGKLRILPATPPSWSGKFTLLARGGFVVSADFAHGKLTKLVIKSLFGNDLHIVSPLRLDLPTEPGKSYRIIP